jgi:hypothetical protein
VVVEDSTKQLLSSCDLLIADHVRFFDSRSCGRMPGLATYTEADRKDRIKLSSLHGSGNISYYNSGL